MVDREGRIARSQSGVDRLTGLGRYSPHVMEGVNGLHRLVVRPGWVRRRGARVERGLHRED